MTITIDGKAIECSAGEYLPDVAKRAGIHIPTLCHHEGLPGQGCCRVCLVEVETGGVKDIVTACVYPVERECTVFTDNERVRKDRGIVLALLRAVAPDSDEIARLCEEHGAPDVERFTIRKENSKCILCGLCVRACESLGTGAISTINRGIDKKVSTPYDEPALVCVGCGSCASVCPVGAIKVEEDGGERKIWNKKLPLARCKRCGAEFGTVFEHYRSSERAGAPPADLCEVCKRKAITDTMAQTFGQ